MKQADVLERGNASMKKYSRHYLRRCLSVLLAVVMVCAAAQTLVFAVDLAAEDITPGWQQGTARARYTTSGALEITFPESTKPDAAYYAEFYDLDGNDRETPVVEAFQLNTARTYADDTTQIGATLDRSWVESHGLNMSHRISIAITAVSSDGWRSEAIEALVGESLDVPEEGSSPDGTDDYVLLANFDTDTNGNLLTSEVTTNSTNGVASWVYDNGGDNVDAINVDGVFGGDNTATYRYQTPGFDSSYAFRMYVNGAEAVSDPNEYESIDIQYNQQKFMFKGAEDLWIWVDTSYVEFEEFAVQVRYSDRTGTYRIDSYDQDLYNGDYPSVAYSDDSYSTVGYAMRNEGKAVPVRYLNEDGLWDTMYTNENGYLENFGHYRGFLRVPVEYLWNDNPEETQYLQVNQERPYAYNIEVWDWHWGNNHHKITSYGTEYESISAETAFEHVKNGTTSELTWLDHNYIGIGESRQSFSLEKFESGYSMGLSVTPIEDIISVGITYRGLSDDSMNKPFYVDHIGFSGEQMTTNKGTSDANPIDVTTSLDSLKMVPNDKEAVDALIDKYLPENPSAATPADLTVIEDLEDICDFLNLPYPSDLQSARSSVEAQMSGAANLVEYVDKQLQETNLSEAQIRALYEIYLGFTLGEIHALGVNNEIKLINLYNTASQNLWYPSALDGLGWQLFNDFESGYTIGQTALHQYDDNNNPPFGTAWYYAYGHILNWSNANDGNINWLTDMSTAWENSQNLVAYSRANENDAVNDTDQRFGYGVSMINQNGFENSLAVNTDIYRQVLSNTENYRISLTAKGQDADSWNDLSGIDASGAGYLAFYADFSNMSDINALWATIRTGPNVVRDSGNSADRTSGPITSSRNTQTFTVLDYDNPNGWETKTAAQLNGFRGFIRIPIASFASLDGRTLDWSDVRQVKIFITGIPGNTQAEGSSFVLDMFGFLYNDESTYTSLKKQSFTEIEEPEGVEDAATQFNGLLATLFVPVTDEKDTYLFDYNAAVYEELIDAYNTLTLSEKADADAALKEASGGKYTGVDELQLFVKNYDDWGGLGDGNLRVNANTANNLRGTVTDAFNANTALIDGTPGEIDSIFDTYQGYPDYYKYSVQTYWPDRNLHAVFPNYNPGEVTVGNSDTNRVGFKLQGGSYTAVVTIPYVGAVSANNSMNFEWPENFELTDVSNNKEVTASITPAGAVVNVDGTISLTLTVPYDSVKNQGTYKGEFTIGVDKDPDTYTAQASNSNPVTDANKYRDTITIYAELVCQPEFTVTIPADTGVEWDSLSTPMEGYEVTECSLPNGAYIEMSVASTDGKYAMTKTIEGKEFTIPYTLSGSGSGTVERFNGEIGSIDLSIDVDAGEWYKPIAEDYLDTLVFTVAYHEATN